MYIKRIQLGIRFIVALAFVVLVGCKKFVQIDPPVNQITATTAYNNNTSAAAVITGIYSNMMANAGLSDGNNGIGYLQGLAADELTNYSSVANLTQFYQNALSAATGGTSNAYYWAEIYNEIHVANAVIEGLSTSSGVSSAMKQQLNGEAKFIRAFLHFYATNLYGDVPLVTSTNYLTNNSIHRDPSAQVYQQIILDLKDAQSDLSSKYVDANGNATSDRIRPNKAVATALLARVYLYIGDWANAAIQADSVLANSSLYSLDSVNQVFLANSTEAVWQLQPVSPGYNTQDAYNYVLQGPPGSGIYAVALSSYLLNAFEKGDERLANWVGTYTSDSVSFYYYPYKYKVYLQNQPVTEYSMVLRLAEQYLIRAEAEARGASGGVNAAIADLNMIRNRAALPNYSGPAIKDSVLAAIQHERQVEFFTEWGHRWFDLKRTGNLNSVMGQPGNVCANKGGVWNPNWALLPIPLNDLQIDPNLTQNAGYQ